MSTLAPALLTTRFERSIVKVFQRRGATTGPDAKRLADLGIKDTAVLQGLVASTVLRRAGPERYFLHEATWAARNHMSWPTVGRIGLIALLALAFLSYWLQ